MLWILLILSAISAFAQGTSLPTLTWTNVTPGGYVAKGVGFDGVTWISGSRKCMAFWGEANPASLSENNDALYCYSYAENRWHMLSVSGGFHSTHRSPQGHDNQVISYASDVDSLFLTTDGSYGNIPENYGGLWQLDMGGLVGIDRPLMSSSGTLKRQWLPGASTPINASVYDSTNHKLIYFTDWNLANGQASICTLSTSVCTLSSTTNGPPVSSVASSISGTFNSTDSKTYWFMTSTTPFYSLDASTGAWVALTPACTGADCTGGHPPVRTGAGLAYSTSDQVILIMGGNNGATTYHDTWKWDTGANTVTELCGPGMTACAYANSSASGSILGNRLIYDDTDNAFIYLNGAGGTTTWAFALTTPLNYGRTAASYAPPVGSLNKTAPPTTPSSSTAQGYAADPNISISGSTIYVAHVETAPSTESNGNCLVLVPYIYNLTGSAYLPTGTLATGCVAIGNGSNLWPSSHPYVASVNGTVWEAHSMINQAGGSADTRSFARSYNGSTWGGSQIGPFTAGAIATVTSTPTGLIAVGTTPTVAVIEQNKNLFVRENYVYVAQWNGSLWSALGGKLNINATGTYATSASIATDGTNPASCWAEEINSARNTLSTTPQIQCAKWSGSAWVRMGTTSLNQTASNWAYSPSITYYAGNWYAAWTERSQLGNLNLYVKVWNSGTNAWTLVGSSLNNNTSTGNAFHATLAQDGTNLYIGWEEQSAIGQHAFGYVKSTTGTSWGSVGSGIAADAVNGSVEDFGIVARSGIVTAAWVEHEWGNLPQVYSTTLSALSVPLTISEALIGGTNGFAGLTRTDEPVTMGVPIPDSVGLTGIGSLGLTGASAAQFVSEANWPSGNIKWLKVRAIVPSVTAAGSATLTLTLQGSGNFGGSNLATDNGTTITVATGTATFTIKKANFNVVNQVVVGSTTVVSAGASTGLVVLGPNPAASYPGNVTCSPTSGGTACTTVYSTSNDAASTCVIEENGPAVAVLKCTANLIDGAAHTYMHTTVREYFAKGRSQMKYTVALRNADYGTSSTFATASKGYQGFEMRITPNISSTLTYTVANHTGTPTSGTMSGTDVTYLYQAESNLLKPTGWCAGFCNPPSTISGYAILNNGSAVQTGTASQYPVGWADISNASGVGVMIGQDQLAGYGNKSLEFRGGGADVRIGMWASENNTTGPSTTTANAPYYAAWPQWSIHNGWLDFHDAALATPQNNHLKLEYPLLGRADVSWYNSAGVFPYPLLDPTEESTYYSTTLAASSPSVPAVAALDDVMGNTGISNTTCTGRGNGSTPTTCVYRYWSWAIPGGSNQMEFRLSGLYNWIRRGYSGQYMDSNYFYKYIAENGFPMSDGFKWTSHAAETQYYGFPTATSTNYALSIAGSGGQSRLNIEADMEHGNAQGYDTFYLVSGDETIKEAYMEAVPPFFANNASASNYTTTSPALWVDRSTGNLFKWAAHLYTFLSSVGDAAEANAILANAQTVYTARVQPDLCAYAGYPTGCVPDKQDNNPNTTLQVGTSKVRGVSNIYRATINGDPACAGIIPDGSRLASSFMASRKLEGMLEFYKAVPTSWAFRQQFWDYIYGGSQWAFGEMMADSGAPAWSNVGLRYDMAFDYPNVCNSSGWALLSNETIWHHWIATANYVGNLDSTKTRQFAAELSRNSFNGNIDEFYHDTMATAIYYILHPPSTTPLTTLSITSFTNNGGGSYTLGWTTPANTVALRVKSGTKTIVDWIGFNAGNYTWVGDPVTTQNWFASTDAAGVPSPVAGTQSMTVTGLAANLTINNFMVKAIFATTTPNPPSGCQADSMGWVITGLSAIQNNLVGPLICYGSNPWTFGDLANKGTVDYMVPIALSEAPVLGTALSGTFSLTSGSDTLNTTVDLTTPLSGIQYIAVAWNSIDGTGTGRLICPIASVTISTVVCSEHFSEPSFSGVTGYIMSVATDSFGCNFTCWTVENPSQSWNYYDVGIALDRLWLRTGNAQYQTWAQQFADIQWQWVIDHGYRTVAPRAASMISQFFRAGEGHSERLPGLYNLVSLYVPLWATNGDLRESGYTLWDAALGAKVDTNATRHTQYCTWLNTYTPNWNASQNADGSWSENEFALNASYVSAPKSFTPPFQYQGAPWREAINIKSLEAAYEALNDTTSQGCNNQALATATLGSVAKAVTWQNNFGRSTANRGVYYEVNSQSNDQSSVSPATGTVSATRGSTALVGVGTNWNTAGYCDGTHFIGLFTPRTVYKIASCSDNTHATLSVAFGLYGEVSNVSGDQFGIAPAASTSCNSSATYCFTGTGDRNLTRTNCGGIGWLYSVTLNATYRTWADECYSASLGGPTAGLNTLANLNAVTLPCSGAACDGLVNDTVMSAANCNVVSNVPPCLFGVSFGNLGKNYGEAFGAPGIDNELAWRLLGSQPQPVAPTITSSSPLPGGTVGTPYSFQFAASGTVPITWTGTSLPSWSNLSSTGALTGTPDAAATSSLSITATNVAGSNTKAFSLTTVNPNIAPTITSTNPITSGATGAPYSYQFTANGTAPITWSGTSLPAWASLSAAGALTGTPNVAATSIVNITATNSAGAAGPTPFSLTITQTPPVATCSPKTGVTPPNVLDIQFQTNMALGIVACTNSLTGNGCTVVDVQRVINAALGQACLIGP